MKAIVAIGVALLVVSAAPADESVESVVLTKVTPQPAATEWRSIMIYLKPTEDMVNQPYPLRDEPYIVAVDDVRRYRLGQRACDTVIEVCRPRADGTFLNPGHPEMDRRPSVAERRRYCEPLEPADPVTCRAPRGSFQ